MTSRTYTRNTDVGRGLLMAARNNPEGLLLLAAGAALLFRTARPGDSSRGQRRDKRRSSNDSRASGRWVDTEQISEVVDGTRDYVADLGGQVSEAAASYATSATRYAGDMGHTVAMRSEQLYEDTTSTLGEATQRILRDQPLMVALAGLAAGAALATAFPRTEFEEKTLGPAGERVAEYAAEKAEELKDAGVEAGQRIKSSAEQRGFTADGMKDMAREAADAFTGALGGDTKTAKPPAGESTGKEQSK
jgi:hypothetical protein